jgi:hypothetical protein
MCSEAAELLLLLQGRDGDLGCRQSSLLQGTALAQYAAPNALRGDDKHATLQLEIDAW